MKKQYLITIFSVFASLSSSIQAVNIPTIVVGGALTAWGGTKAVMNATRCVTLFNENQSNFKPISENPTMTENEKIEYLIRQNQRVMEINKTNIHAKLWGSLAAVGISMVGVGVATQF